MTRSVEQQIRMMLDKYQESNFTVPEVRRCLAEVIAIQLEKRIKKMEEHRVRGVDGIEKFPHNDQERYPGSNVSDQTPTPPV